MGPTPDYFTDNFIVPKLLSKFMVETRTELLDGACGGKTQPAVFHSNGTPHNFPVENLPPSIHSSSLHVCISGGSTEC